ncbi:DUF465 domain-containing protein [Bradyrhizobium sp.]|uniref:YdcH family protein n=1 Tax=Bradyrhizobium sp. TaxID=376 RepID=UPI0025C55F79|nr:DUF465 domain-containing protein [Bradyrhizobium sp.]MCA3254887.1 DUF465 domain-containing protein [Alphaproteobacteria bacterium]MCA3569193.1 DUF465 domain-containing protein [Bradyrhizobium sp.]
MSDHGHSLHAEFPDAQAALAELKTGNAHFRTLAERYHELAQEIFRIEAGLQASSDERLETLKKQRLAILDEIAAMLPAKAA